MSKKFAAYLLTVLLAFSILTACSGGSDCTDSGHPAPEQTSQAIVLAREEALSFTPDAKADSIEIMQTLIEVRIRETRLREAGHTELADTYINTFLTTLDSVNHSLRTQLK